MRIQLQLLVGLLALIFSFNRAFCQGFQVNFQGQKQQGMGCAGSGFIQDASTLFFNPAGAGFSKKSEVNAACSPIIGNIMFVDSATQQVHRSENPIGTPFNLYVLLKSKKAHRLAYGLSVTTPFGSTVQYAPNWIGRFALTRLSMKVFHIQPTVAYKITDNLSLGVGMVFSPGSVNLQKDVPVQFDNGNFGHAEISGSAMGYGYNAGIYYDGGGILSAGFSYRSGINMAVQDGKVTFTVPTSLSANFPSGELATSLSLPSVSTLGIHLRPSEKIHLVLDVNHVGWKTYDTLAFDYAQNTSSLADTKSARNYKNIFAFRGGVQYDAFSKDKTPIFQLRLGGGYGFSPVQDGYLTPETPDGNRAYITAGFSWIIGSKWSVDASVYATRIQRADTNLETNLSGTFTTLALAPGLGINFTW
ncbi:MAG: long-chain fatty acid transporter [Flavobacteriia bacterium]|nr:long-chain fatty acid transporter [Flavobacteriia bacterium]